jgi:hypothetical protein
LHQATRKAAFGAISAALAVAILFVSTLLPTLQLSAVALAGMLSAAVLIEAGAAYSTLCYAAVSILSLLLLPEKSSAVFYFLFFGHYPIVKYLLERLRSPVLCWAGKIICANLCFFALWGVLRLFFPDWEFPLALWLLWGLGNATFVMFDIALTRLIAFYQFRIRARLR